MKRFLILVFALMWLASGALAESDVSAEQMLNVYGDQDLSATYTYLQGGGALESGSRGEAAMGLQRVLIALGQPITADGIIGGQTIAALQRAQREYGLTETEAVDSSAFMDLLIRALAVKDLASAEAFLESLPLGEAEYIRACAHWRNGRFYSARRAFEACGWADGAERAALCEQDWPASGRLWRDEALVGNDAKLSVRYGGGYGLNVRVYTAEGACVASLFVGGGGEADVTLPAGEYMIATGCGLHWFGAAESFGEDAVYERMLFEGEAEGLTLNSAENAIISVDMGEGEGPMAGAEPLTWDKF